MSNECEKLKTDFNCLVYVIAAIAIVVVLIDVYFWGSQEPCQKPVIAQGKEVCKQ